MESLSSVGSGVRSQVLLSEVAFFFSRRPASRDENDVVIKIKKMIIKETNQLYSIDGK